MAEKNNKYEDNLPGVFYVSDGCIDCFACQSIAPENFKRNDDNGYSYVYKQPENEEEYKICEDAMGGCPVEVIGDDGDE